MVVFGCASVLRAVVKNVMHSFSVALFPLDIVDVRGRIKELFAPYYSEMEVEEYKSFFPLEYVLTLAGQHGTGNDLELLVRVLKEKGSDDVGLEGGRFYRLSTYNAKAKWDYWSVGGCYDRKVYNQATAQIGQGRGWDESLCANICLVSLLPVDVIPAILITPTGEWHECEDFGWRMISSPQAKEKAWTAWTIHARQLLQQYSDHIAVGLDIHS